MSDKMIEVSIKPYAGYVLMDKYEFILFVQYVYGVLNTPLSLNVKQFQARGLDYSMAVNEPSRLATNMRLYGFTVGSVWARVPSEDEIFKVFEKNAKSQR